MLDGKIITGEITFTKENEILIESNRRLINKELSFYKDEVFSVSRGNEKSILYIQDTCTGKMFSVNEMAGFIEGLQDGRKNYHAPFATIGGFVTGVTGGFFGFWGMTIPTTYVFIVGIKTPKLNLKRHSELPERINIVAQEVNQYGLKNTVVEKDITVYEESIVPYYKYGYETAAKDKKIKNAICGSIVGFVTLVVTSYFLVAR